MNNPITLAGLKIVLVDDEEMLNEVNKALLEKAGATVSVFVDAIKAIQHIETNNTDIDVVLCDYQMPGQIKGDQIYRMINKDHPSIKCIMLSGFISSEILGVPIEDILQKPISYKDLLNAISR
jgi:CheY-like chemotaxis protein